VLVALLALAVLAALCAVVAYGARASGAVTGPAGATPAFRAESHARPVVWLCRPGAANDPCTFPRAATSVPAAGPRFPTGLTNVHPPSARKFDCFFVYPTVSTEHSDNSNLEVQVNEVGAAIDEASLFSRVCTVWAPMYRQATARAVSGLGTHRVSAALEKAETVAYASLLDAWKSFVARDDHGRPFVLIGHSQGAVLLIKLIADQIDAVRSLRSRLVVAILAGGNVQVPTGKKVGGSFRHVPLCSTPRQPGCVIAWSSFPAEPPAGSMFGRPGQGVSLQGGQRAAVGQQVACVNPAAIGGGTAPLDDYFLREVEKVQPPVTTQWLTFPHLYTGRCESRDGATWLQVTDVAAHGDRRPVVTESMGPAWGFHSYDVNLVLGNLVQDVASEEAGWVTIPR
jgi:hypothetical protein